MEGATAVGLFFQGATEFRCLFSEGSLLNIDTELTQLFFFFFFF